MRQLICQAIESRRCIRFRYDDHARLVEPYVYGETRDGKELVRGYQVGGGSVSESEPRWRMFEVDRMTSLKRTDRGFRGPPPDYNPDDPAIETIFCQL